MTHSLEPSATNPESSLPLTGRRVYSPATIAAFTALANLPFGLILYGLNIRARGQRGTGQAMVGLGVTAFVVLIIMALKDALPRYFALIGFLGAINVYQLEKRPFARALAQGAARARWWPPVLVLLAILGLLLFIELSVS